VNGGQTGAVWAGTTNQPASRSTADGPAASRSTADGPAATRSTADGVTAMPGAADGAASAPGAADGVTAMPGTADDPVSILDAVGGSAGTLSAADDPVPAPGAADGAVRPAPAEDEGGLAGGQTPHRSRGGEDDGHRDDRADGRGERVVSVASVAEVWCQALIVRGRSRVARDPGAARVDFARAAQLAAERAGPRVHVAALLATATVDLYDHADSLALDLAREVAVATGQLGQVAAVDLFRAEAAVTVRGPQAAAAQARELIDLTSRLRLFHLQALAEVVLAADRAVAADDTGMAALLDAAVARPAASVEVPALADLVRALRALADGDLGAAVARLDVAAERLAAHDTAAPMPVWGLWAVLRTVQRDRDVAARETVRALPAGQRAANRGGLFFADAIAAGRSGDRVTAAALLDEGDWRLAEHPWWGRLLRLFTMRAAADGGWLDPVPRLRTDLAFFGATPFARICRELLRRAGAPTRRGRGDSTVPDDLRALGVTSGEMDVLRLLVSGLSDAEIAARLHLSPRTVNAHVATLLAKTGAAGRAELRRFLLR
jgi:DNA-binding CsgD family transcriptional regulator